MADRTSRLRPCQPDLRNAATLAQNGAVRFVCLLRRNDHSVDKIHPTAPAESICQRYRFEGIDKNVFSCIADEKAPSS